ncbi:contact-dependent growth inhibition system immunity protein [Herbaspirillum sp. GCM10030257]|uniref:contact-dependent growth inhibition system immunity protein n=1 Tax=Herbaspirillum sp. GCM10030257 TaxID=3273393 RepID=UPI003620D2FE
MTSEFRNNLRQFFGAYFHQDWTLDAMDPDDIVRLFINDGFCVNELMNLANHIEMYAAAMTDDTVTEENLLIELGCYYLPSADCLGARAWLYHVANLLRSADQ